jgi:hypothetical protein
MKQGVGLMENHPELFEEAKKYDIAFAEMMPRKALQCVPQFGPVRCHGKV